MKKIIACVLVLALTLTLAACGKQANMDSLEDISETNENSCVGKVISDSFNGPYISITYGRDNPDNFSGRDMVFYSYDITAKQLTQEGAIPFDAKYASGVVSKADHTIYFSRRSDAENLSSNDSLCAYNIETRETTVLERENFSYNEITLADPNTLLVMAVTNEHPIMPALFDLKARMFTYMPDVNNEPRGLYTSGSSPINYNYNTEAFINIYREEKEVYSSAYNSFETEINTYIALANKDLTKKSEKIFPVSLLQGHFIDNAVQISDNELLVERTDDYFDETEEKLITERHFYSLVFGTDGDTTFTPIEPPFPVENVRGQGYRTVDGGKTWYLILNEKSDTDGGLYVYDTENGKMTPILLNNPAVAGYVINFSIIG